MGTWRGGRGYRARVGFNDWGSRARWSDFDLGLLLAGLVLFLDTGENIIFRALDDQVFHQIPVAFYDVVAAENPVTGTRDVVSVAHYSVEHSISSVLISKNGIVVRVHIRRQSC